MASEPRFRIDFKMKLVAALVRRRRRPDPQCVEVVTHWCRVLVLGDVVDREVHELGRHHPLRWGDATKVALRDVDIGKRELAADDLADLEQVGLGRGDAPAETEVGEDT